jgi:hypothetical protein
MKPAGNRPVWFAMVDGASSDEYLVNMAWLKVGGKKISAVKTGAKKGTRLAACSEGGQCVGFIRENDWLTYKDVDFGAENDTIELRVASLTEPSEIEIRLGKDDGELLGTAKVVATGDWQKWTSVSANIKPTLGKKDICLVIRPARVTTDNTTIWAQFPGVDPNVADVEINVRKTVFTPGKTGVNYITLRGFTLRNAATNWAPPTAGQIGLVSAYWCKVWIIEDNDIGYSRCSGIALGKYSDDWDNRSESAEGFVGTLTRALKNGWNKDTVASHDVRRNHIHHCEQTGVVGSLGCSFSTVRGNDIHDIHVLNRFGGAEMAGIKFHGAIHVIISDNHIYRCGPAGGIWLDWMAQGAQVARNLLHDNQGEDIFCEIQHGPLLIANNRILSAHAQSLAFNSQEMAVVHNLIRGPVWNFSGDESVTPFHYAHNTALAGMYPSAAGDSGDDRFNNNLFVAPCTLRAVNNSASPCFAAGNVFTKGTEPSNFDKAPLVIPDFDPAPRLLEMPDRWYLDIALDAAWADQTRGLVTTVALGRAKVPNASYENPDGASLKVDTDYFDRKRNGANPFPGPFELPRTGGQTIKVWPKQ